MINAIWQLVLALPQILKLIDEIDKRNKELEIQRKVKDDVKVIHEAFVAKDAKKLNDLFNSK